VIHNTDIVRVPAIFGSLRRASSNSALVSAAVRVTPDRVEVSAYSDLADVPPFNPDLDTDAAPAGVVRLRAALEACDAILICSPEYAHGVSGVLKNALDWVADSIAQNGHLSGLLTAALAALARVARVGAAR